MSRYRFAVYAVFGSVTDLSHDEGLSAGNQCAALGLETPMVLAFCVSVRFVLLAGCVNW